MSGTEGLDDRLLQLVTECLDRIAREGDGALEELCAAHPERAGALRRHVGRLRDMGMLERSGGAPTVAATNEDTSLDLDDEGSARLWPTGGATSRYVLKDEIARGGMGAVLRVFDKDLRRHLAMKVALVPGEPLGAKEEIDPRTLGRFLEEAQVTGQLEHPGIVPVHELGVDANGRLFFTMRLVRGETLREVIDHVHSRAAGWNRTRALGVLQKVCDAMAYAHEKGVLHRDLKPANVMVGRFGETYVMDWGLARVLGRPDRRDLRLCDATTVNEVRTDRREAAASEPDSPLVTMDGDVVGTPAYMSPEQAEGRIEELGPPADVYAVGAILYHLLAGHMPYVRRGARTSPRTVLALLLQGPPSPLEEEADDVPVELAAICAKAMARRADDRYADMGALSDDLRAYLEQRVVKAHATGPYHELRKWVTRNRAFAATAAAAILAVLLLAAWGWIERRSALSHASDANANANRAKENAELATRNAALAQDAAERATESEREMREQRDRAREAEAVAEEAAYRASYHAALVAFDLGDRQEAARRLRELSPRDGDWERGFLDVALDRAFRHLLGHEGPVTTIAFSPDGGRLASTSRDGTVRVWTIDANEPRLVLASSGAPSSAAWSEDGRLVAVGTEDGSVRIHDAVSGAVIGSPLRLGRAARWVGFANDGSLLTSDADGTLSVHRAGGRSVAVAHHIARNPPLPLVDRGDSSLVLARRDALERIDPIGGRGARAIFDRSNDVTCAAIDAATGTVVAVSQAGVARVFAGRPGALEREIAISGRPPVAVAIRSGARTFATASADGLSQWDAATGERTGRYVGETARATALAYSRDGTFVAAGCEDGTIHVWVAASAVSDRLELDADRVDAVAFDTTGSWLAFGVAHSAIDAHTVVVLDATTGEIVARHVATAAVTALAFDAGGARLAAATRNGKAAVFPVTAVEDVAVFEVGDAPTGLAFVAGGTSLLVGAADGSLRLFSVAGGRPSPPPRARGPAAVLPDGTIVARAIDAEDLVVLDARSLAVTRRVTGVDAPILAVAVSPDGRRIAASSEDRVVRLFDLASGDVLHRFVSDAPIQRLSFGPDGARLACARDGRVLILDSTATDGTFAWNVLLGEDAASDFLAIDPRGARVVASGPGGVRLFHADRADAARFWAATDRRNRVEQTVVPLLERVGRREDALAALHDLSAELRPLAAARVARPDDPLAPAWAAAAWRALDPDVPSPSAGDGLELARRAVRAAPGHAAHRRLLAWSLGLNAELDAAVTAARLAARLDDGAEPDSFALALDAIVASAAEKPLRVDDPESVAAQLSARGLGHALAAIREANDAALRRVDPGAETRFQRAQRLHAEALVSFPPLDADAAHFATTIQRAEEAASLVPWEPLYLHTVGVARYRAGHLDLALDALRRADRWNQASTPRRDRTRDLLYLALCHLDLGDEEIGRRLWRELRPLPLAQRDPEVVFALRELDQKLRLLDARETDAAAEAPP